MQPNGMQLDAPVQKALTKAIQLDFCRVVSIISKRGGTLRRRFPWQLAVLIEDHKCMEVGEQ